MEREAAEEAGSTLFLFSSSHRHGGPRRLLLLHLLRHPLNRRRTPTRDRTDRPCQSNPRPSPPCLRPGTTTILPPRPGSPSIVLPCPQCGHRPSRLRSTSSWSVSCCQGRRRSLRRRRRWVRIRACGTASPRRAGRGETGSWLRAAAPAATIVKKKKKKSSSLRDGAVRGGDDG